MAMHLEKQKFVLLQKIGSIFRSAHRQLGLIYHPKLRMTNAL